MSFCVFNLGQMMSTKAVAQTHVAVIPVRFHEICTYNMSD